MEVLLTDRAGNILHQTDLRKFGIQPAGLGNTREENKTWNETVSADVINKVRTIAIKHSYEPTIAFAASIAWLREHADDISTTMKCIQKYSGQEEEEQEVVGGPDQNQESSSGPTVLECAEAAEDLGEGVLF